MIKESEEFFRLLTETDEIFQLILENTNDFIAIINEKFEYEYINEQTYLNKLGYLKDDLIGKMRIDLIHPDDIKQGIKILREGFKTREERKMEGRFRHKNGQYVWLEARCKAFIDKDGKKKGLIIARDISDRKKAEQKLIESEEKYRLISENANDLIYVLNHNFEFEYVNKESCLHTLGFSNRDLIGKSALRYIHHEDLKHATKNLRSVFEIGEASDVFRFRNKKSKYVWLEIRGKAFTDSKGHLKGLIISRDISIQKKGEQKLKESEEKFRNITEQLLMGICILQDDKIKYVNKKHADIWGYTIEEMMNWKQKDYIKAIHSEDLEMVVEQAKKKQHGDKDVIIHYPFRGIKKTGETVWVDNYARTIIYNGKFADLVTIIDITDRNLAEQKLKESEKKYRHLFEKSPFSIILVDSKGKIVDCNPATEKLIQFKKEEVIGKKFTDLSIVPQKYIPLLIERLKHFFEAGTLTPIELQLCKKDGSLIWTQVQSSLIEMGDRILNQVIGYDITERKKAELLIEEEIEKLKQLDKIRRDLITRISHELKIPIMLVLGASELLLDNLNYQLGKNAIELVNVMRKGGKRLDDLVNDLIDTSRIEHNKFELIKKIDDLSEIIKDCSNEMQYQIIKRQITMDLILPEIVFVEVDRKRIEHVIMNLLSNAIKNTPPKGRIKIILKKFEDWAKFSVSDTGIGLTEDEMDRIFTRFGKIERYGKGFEYLDIQGSGLGLFISKEIVDLHGGKIWVESKGRHKGCTFTVKLKIK